MKSFRLIKLLLLTCIVVTLGVATALARTHSESPDPGGHTNQGVKYAEKKQYDKAIEEFTKAIGLQPNDLKNYENRALSYRLSGKTKEAIADYAKLIELQPDNAAAYAGKAQLEVQEKNFDARLSICRTR